MSDDIAQTVKDFFMKYPSRVFDKGEILVQAGEASAGIFYIVEGRVNQYDITPEGVMLELNVFKAGAFFPMSSAVNNLPNNYFFEAATTKVVARVAPSKDAVQFLRDNPEVLFDLLSRVYRGVDGILKRMAHLMGSSARNRLIFELLTSSYRFGEVKNNGSVFIALKEIDIARQSGLARETVSRTIRKLKAEGLVEVKRSGITLISVPKLEALILTGS